MLIIKSNSKEQFKDENGPKWPNVIGSPPYLFIAVTCVTYIQVLCLKF